ncbi:hypothetical protein [uncultured Mucilaginibacter sp.]|uniref:hypothetical protein n=1 Tax=uncultured Mucilaginibacter sp. TaxID=797541 RepID=UPI0025D23FAC|nr:hypothetical protein [uncultured Mucilaginibacter sp.]
MNSSRTRLWALFFLGSFVVSLLAMALISVLLYHNGIFDAIQESFIPSSGAAFIFSLVVFIRPQN